MLALSRTFQRGLAAVLTSVLVGCGGGTTDPGSTPPPTPPPPPPPPPAAVASVALQPGTFSLVPQQTQQITATVKDAQGNALSGRTVTWSSNAEAVATVSTAGLVTAVKTGTARITATSEGQSGTAELTVAAGAQVGTTGGTFTFEDGAVKVTVPSGAVTTSTVLTVTKVTNPTSTVPTGFKRVGPVYAVGPAGAVFTKPVTLTLGYVPAQLPAFTMTGDVGVYQATGSTGRALTAVSVNTASKTVSGQTSGLGASAPVGVGSSAVGVGGVALLAGESEVSVVVQDPEVDIAPSSASVNGSHRNATFTVAVEARGQGVPLPENTPTLKYRWRSTTQNGGLGIDAPGPNAWTETATVEYVATNPQLGSMSGEIDKVFVDVLLNPESLTNPNAGPQRIVTAEAKVDANLELVYDIAPQNVKVKQAETTDLRVRVRDKQGNERGLGSEQTVSWQTSGNHGKLLAEEGETVTYEADDEFLFPPPRVDRVVMSVSKVERREQQIRSQRKIPNESGEMIALYDAVDLEVHVTQGVDTAFVTVEADYKATLKASRDTVQPGTSTNLTAKLDPVEEKIKYRFSSAQTMGKLTPASGTVTTAAVAQYVANNFPAGGKEKVKVEILDQSGLVLAEKEIEIVVDPWRSGGSLSVLQEGNCVVPYIVIPKITGATSYEVLADKFNHPTIGTTFTKTFSGATGTALYEVQDNGSSWKIRMEGGGCAISDEARAAMRQAMLTRFAGIRIRHKVTGGP